MTLDALFASAATQAPTEGPMIPLDEMPLGAFKEMVERHLGRELTDDTGRDLAAWLESTLPAGETPTAEASTAMAHLLVGMAREESLEPTASAPDDEQPVEAATTLGARLSTLARSLGLPVGRRGDVDAAQVAPAVELPLPVDGGIATGPGPEQVAARKPGMRPPLSKAQRQAVVASASNGTTPLVIDLRGEDPFALAALGGGRPSPLDAAHSSLTGLEALSAGASPTPAAATTDQPAAASQQGAADGVSPLEAFLAMGDATPAAETPEQTAAGVAFAEGGPGAARAGSSGNEPVIRFDISPAATTHSTEAQPGVRAQGAATPAPSVVPPMAVERVMRIVELQATAPPPRMAVVEIPELDGLRIMVSITDRGAVSVTALGGLADSVQAPFMQSVATALETQGFLLDERNRGRSEEQPQHPHRERPDRDQPRRRPRPDGLFA